MGLTFGLGAALCWGLADFYAALASRRVGALRVVLASHVVAMIVLASLMVGLDGFAPLTWRDILPFVGVGALGWLSYLTLYAALAIGPVAVVSPIVSGSAAVAVLLAVVILGERLSLPATAAISITILGVALASADVRQIWSGALKRSGAGGFVLALCAMVLFGAFVFSLAYYEKAFGWLAPIFLGRGFALLFLLAHAAAARQLAFPERTPALLSMVGFIALVDTGGFVLFSLGAGAGDTAVVAAASSPYSLVSIAMGVIILAERPTSVQWIGVALVIGGIVGLGVAV